MPLFNVTCYYDSSCNNCCEFNVPLKYPEIPVREVSKESAIAKVKGSIHLRSSPYGSKDEIDGDIVTTHDFLPDSEEKTTFIYYGFNAELIGE